MIQTGHNKLFINYNKLNKRKVKSTAVSMSLARVKSIMERICDLVNL